KHHATVWMPARARAGRTTRTTDRASNTRVNRFIGILQPACVGWLAGGGRIRALGWLARLLRQDELVGPRDAEPVLLLAVLDDDLAPGAEQVFRPDARAPRRGARAERARGAAALRHAV